MELGKYHHNNRQLVIDQEDNYEINTESGPDSPPNSTFLNDLKNMTSTSTSTSSPKRSKRAIQKRVVSVPLKDVEGARLKGETAPPPSDSWAWRKYGQKPIKGSPYPRGYYRCSSSKGCPARKQVERSRVDPTMLVVTYSCEHNHPWPPPSKSNHYHHHTASAKSTSNTPKPEISIPPRIQENPEPEPELELEPEEKFTNLGDESLISRDEFSWFSEMETTSSTILEIPIFADDHRRSTAEAEAEAETGLFFPMREDDESLFADLGELPECSTVFRHHRGADPQVQIC